MPLVSRLLLPPQCPILFNRKHHVLGHGCLDAQVLKSSFLLSQGIDNPSPGGDMTISPSKHISSHFNIATDVSRHTSARTYSTRPSHWSVVVVHLASYSLTASWILPIEACVASMRMHPFSSARNMLAMCHLSLHVLLDRLLALDVLTFHFRHQPECLPPTCSPATLCKTCPSSPPRKSTHLPACLITAAPLLHKPVYDEAFPHRLGGLLQWNLSHAKKNKFAYLDNSSSAPDADDRRIVETC